MCFISLIGMLGCNLLSGSALTLRRLTPFLIIIDRLHVVIALVLGAHLVNGTLLLLQAVLTPQNNGRRLVVFEDCLYFTQELVITVDIFVQRLLRVPLVQVLGAVFEQSLCLLLRLRKLDRLCRAQVFVVRHLVEARASGH